MEDIESNTVANNLANLIVHFERDKSWGQNQMKDEEEICYSDDEEEILSNSEDEELLDEIQRSMNLIRKIKIESRVTVDNLSRLSNRCIHAIDKAILRLCGFLNDTEQINGENEKVNEMNKETVSILSNQIINSASSDNL